MAKFVNLNKFIMIHLLSASPEKQSEIVKRLLGHTITNVDRDILVNNWEDEYETPTGYDRKVARDFAKYGVMSLSTPYHSPVADELNEDNFYGEFDGNHFCVHCKGMVRRKKGTTMSGIDLAEFAGELLQNGYDPKEALEYILSDVIYPKDNSTSAVITIREEGSRDLFLTSFRIPIVGSKAPMAKIPMYVTYPDRHSIVLGTNYNPLSQINESNMVQVTPCEVFRLFISDDSIDIDNG